MGAVQNLARWLFLFSLVEAPWAYGSTRPWALELLDGLLALSFVLNLPGLVQRRFRGGPPLPVLCLGLLLLETGWMWFNARSYLDDAFWEFVPLLQPAPAWPGSWDRAATESHLEALAALFGGFLVASDLVNEPRWRARVWLTMAGTGISVVVYGIAQRILGAPSVFWRAEKTGATFFGPFIYHGNAGSFLNLIWPVLALLLIRSFRRQRAHLERALWASCLFLTLTACVVNISRAAAAITLLLGLVSYFWIFPHARTRPAGMSWWKGLVLLGLFGLFVAGLVLAGSRSVSEHHWTQLAAHLNEANPRFLTYDACLRTIPEAGWWGYGAGTFSAIFPYHTMYLGDRIYGFWMYAHEDYLQTVIEYGYVGAAVWSLYFFGGLGVAYVRAIRTRPDGGVTDRLGYAAPALALSGIALHSLVDFPLQVPSIQLYVMVFIALAWRGPSVARTAGGEGNQVRRS